MAFLCHFTRKKCPKFQKYAHLPFHIKFIKKTCKTVCVHTTLLCGFFKRNLFFLQPSIWRDVMETVISFAFFHWLRISFRYDLSHSCFVFSIHDYGVFFPHEIVQINTRMLIGVGMHVWEMLCMEKCFFFLFFLASHKLSFSIWIKYCRNLTWALIKCTQTNFWLQVKIKNVRRKM